VSVGKLPQPRILKDAVEAMRASTPHLQAANATQEKLIALLREVQDEHSGLSDEERAARRKQIDQLREQARDESRAARRPMDDLKERYARWIK
jgi:hypothetical protein